jgi:uncharacterized membrane protein
MNRETKKPNIGTAERWISLALGAEFIYRGLKKHSWSSVPAALVGGGLLYRGVSQHCPLYDAMGVDRSSSEGHRGPDAVASVVIAKPAAELYRFWRDLRNAPRFMSHVSHVTVTDDTHSEWTMSLPGGHNMKWHAEIEEDLPDSGFQWKSGEGSPLSVNGSVRFKEAPAGRGTQVIAGVRFSRSGGGLLGKLAAPLAEYRVHSDLQRFKSLMETGEIATTKGQTSGRVWANRSLAASEVPA